jgi:glycosyltransferase involved in cell wall biosynthesis
MYSGTGRAVFDWIRCAHRELDFTVLMDTEHEHNFSVTRAFCEEMGIPLLSSASLPLPGCIDAGIRAVADVLGSRSFDFVECVSWASAATNLSVLASLPPASRLVFVPHSQPQWTIPGSEGFFMTSPVFRRMLEEAEFTFLDSPEESKLPEFANLGLRNTHIVPLGVDTDLYRPSRHAARSKQILTVCDVREERKRVDLLLRAFEAAYAVDPGLRLVIGGRGSDELYIAASIRPAVELLGYLDEPTLVDRYRAASLFVLLTDYEAFGLPIAEALCCGTPVLLNRLAVLESLFAGLPGVTFTDNVDVEMTSGLMRELASGQGDRDAVALAARAAFAFESTYGRKLQILQSRFEMSAA